jgi:hypothetical protein
MYLWLGGAMEQKSITGLEADLPGKGAIVKNYDSWTIKLYKKKRRIVIETHDYHADPLMLTRDELCDLAQLMGLHVRKRRNKRQQDAMKAT